VARFIRWAVERGIEDPIEVTRLILATYQRYLYYYLVRNNHILHNPASDLDMPRIEKRLPRARVTCSATRWRR
jgi:integrase/recombinase XerD